MNDTPERMIPAVGGKLFPEHVFRPERVLEHDLCLRLAERAKALRDLIAQEKATMISEIDAFKELLFAQYGVRVGGRRDGLQLHSSDQSVRAQVSVADAMTFGPELDAAKQLIDECLTDWTTDANANLRAVVMAAFDVGEGKKPRVDRILALRQFQFDDPRWKRAMEAIADALRVAYSRRYLRIYERANEDAPFVQIVLDMSRL